MTRKKLSIIMSVIFVLVFGFMTMPFSTKWINTLDPHIMGLPCMQFFIIATCLFFCVFLIVWYLLDTYYDNKEIKERDEREGVSNNGN